MVQKPRWGELEEEADGGDYDYLLPPKQVIGPDEHGLKVQIQRRSAPWRGVLGLSSVMPFKRTSAPNSPWFLPRKSSLSDQGLQVFEASSLQIFSLSELDYLLCGRREMWEADTLVEHIKFDHGYTSKSPVVINLLEIMGEFNPKQQRAFCQFVTGAPRLPPGGLAVLNPKLTIVRKFYLVSDIAVKELIAVATNREDSKSVVELTNGSSEDTKEQILQRIFFVLFCRGYPSHFPKLPLPLQCFFVSVYFVHQVKLVEERNMKSLDSNLAALVLKNYERQDATLLS
ncbi:unnamed protein product [Lactuca saligna]|uniref:HECT domain-containing protein n=1 Tax=Lactuca saligna TaxID=75948 RepID=A0AA35ZEV1_LACSI|nr:unnamed protein product [Lactuca saligna]